jgi:hypothetical protein
MGLGVLLCEYCFVNLEGGRSVVRKEMFRKRDGTESDSSLQKKR